ncbi:MAG: spermidine synthase, partial [Deltaproteobacteria bacterium]|nr:spermidine synthase [Deltaproteobacteria bacterium]
CEIDPLVVRTCRKYFPEVSAGLDDPRVRIIHEDGAALVRDSSDKFDVILIDSTDPIGPGAALFKPEFYRSVKERLSEDGAAVFQTENPLFMEDVFSMAVRDLMDVFGPAHARPYLCTVPCYPGGLWSFTFCAKKKDPLKDALVELPSRLDSSLRYYNRDVHCAAFALPVFVEKLLGDRHSSTTK